MGKWIVGAIMVAIGILMVIYTDKIVEFAGRLTWAEIHLSEFGGTKFFVKLLGIGMIVLAMIVATGVIGSILDMIFKPTKMGFFLDSV